MWNFILALRLIAMWGIYHILSSLFAMLLPSSFVIALVYNVTEDCVSFPVCSPLPLLLLRKECNVRDVFLGVMRVLCFLPVYYFDRFVVLVIFYHGGVSSLLFRCSESFYYLPLIHGRYSQYILKHM